MVEGVVLPRGGTGAGIAFVGQGRIGSFKAVLGASASNEPKRSNDCECAALHHVGVTF